MELSKTTFAYVLTFKSLKDKQYHPLTFIESKCTFSWVEIKFVVTKRQSFTLLENPLSTKDFQ